MNKAPMSWLLRVFSGPHSGAEVVLTAGEQIIGAGAQSDIILDDPLISEQHLCLRVNSDAVDLSPIDAAVFVNGEQVTEMTLPAFDVVQLGKTQFAIGPENGEWPSINLPALRSLEDLNANSTEDTEDSTAEEVGEETNEAEKATEEESATEEQPTGSSGTGRWLVSLVVIVILLLGGFVVAMESDWLGESTDTAEEEVTVESLQAVVAEVAPESSVEIKENNGRFEASGFVMTRDEEQKLVDAILKVDRSADVVDVDHMEGKVKLAKGMLRFGDLKSLNIAAKAPGQLVATGQLDDLTEWNQKRQEIEERTKVAIADEVKLPKVEAPVQPKPALPPTERIATPIVPSASPATVAPSQEAPREKPEGKEFQVPLLVRDVTIGRNRFLTTVTGYDVHEGSLLGGFVVKAITSEYAVLSKDGGEYILRYEVQQ